MRKNSFFKMVVTLVTFCVMMMGLSLTAFAADWYISPSGSDSNSGSKSSPFATLNKVEAAASSGDTVYIMGGTYKNFPIETSDANYNYVHQFTKSNITYRAYYSKNVPVFDFSGTTTSKRVAAFHVKSGVKGVTFLCFKVTNVPVGSQKQSECFRIEGSATMNQITACNSNANGFYFCNNGTGKVIKCDAYNLFTSNSVSNSNTDGFGAHGKGVTFTQCRAWACGDDGYDCITSKGSNTFDKVFLVVGIMIVICLLVAWIVADNSGKEDNLPKQQNVKSKIESMTIKLDGCDIKLNKIKAGSFKMGSYEGVGEEDELPVRDIKITKDFYIGVYEITQAQWEYACRAGSETKWFFGDDEVEFSKYCEDDIDAKTYEVGQFKPNGNGLYDMYGNVMEWCLDYYSPEYLKDDVTDPKGPAEGEAKVSRGGGWGGSPDLCRSGYRNACGENDATDGIGFRIVVNP